MQIHCKKIALFIGYFFNIKKLIFYLYTIILLYYYNNYIMDNIFDLCKTGNLEGIQQLEEEFGIDNIINHTNKYGWSPFITAAIYGHLNIVKYLVANGCNIHVKQNNANIMTHIIFNKGDKLNKNQLREMIYYIIHELNFDINRRDVYGNTYLHYALANDKIDSANILLEMGINKYLQNQYNDFAFDLVSNKVLEKIPNEYTKEYLQIELV